VIRHAAALVVAVFIAGCASGQEARVAARAVLAETLQYERLVDRKIASEEAYYANRAKSLNEALDRAMTATTALEIVKDSRRAADAIVKRGTPATAMDVTEFVAVVVRSQGEAFDTISDKRHELRTLVTDSLVPLELDKSALKRLRKALETLQTNPGEFTRLKSLYEFVDATRAAYKKLREEDAQTGQ
jgi:hypothetical protein